MALWTGHALDLVPEVVDPNIYKYNVTSWLGAAATVIFSACGAMYALSAVTRALETERQRADEAANARATFLARMSHELRTPMTGVIGMAELLEGTKLTTEQTNMTSRLLRAARGLLQLLNDVLDFSKIEAGRILVENAAFRISDTINEIYGLFSTTAQQNSINLSTGFPHVYSDAVIGDRHKIGQVLLNLVGNALKFTPRGSVSIQVIQAVNGEGLPLTTFSVTDTGIGISSEELARLFQPFVQADSSTTRKYGGSGLGLVISQSLVQAMGGELTVVSTPGRGSTFSFTLPLVPDRTVPAKSLPAHHMTAVPALAPVASNAPGADPPAASQPLLRITPGLRILLVDDDPMVHALMKIVLEDAKAEVTSADNGAKAVDAVKRGAFDLILIDMHMPVMDGIAATRSIRAVESAKSTPVIALTADIISSGKTEVLTAGANAVVSKPIVWPQLQAEINAVLKAA
ncbi:MAG: response regulator [Rhodospirillaceae bacterium]|nr:response regulator [Rhodospirillaceae bacterium]